MGNSDDWHFSECSERRCVNPAPCSPKTCGVGSKWCNKQGSKQETEKGSMMVIMKPGSKSARNKHVFKPPLIHVKFLVLDSSFSLISHLHLLHDSKYSGSIDRIVCKTVKVICSRVEAAKRWMERLQLWPKPVHSKKQNYVSLQQTKVSRVQPVETQQ